MGLAFLAAYEATQDKQYLDAARAAGEALMYGQLKSGGWQNNVDFDPQGKGLNLYRNGKGRGAEQLDARRRHFADGDPLHGPTRRSPRIQGSKAFMNRPQFALDALLKAQFANGAFPQIWTGPVPQVEVKPASYPDYDYRTEGKVKDYWNMYTLNDGLAGTVSETLLAAHDVYKDDKYLQALTKLGDFLILAQMPDAAAGLGAAIQPRHAADLGPPLRAGWHHRRRIAGRDRDAA